MKIRPINSLSGPFAGLLIPCSHCTAPQHQGPRSMRLSRRTERLQRQSRDAFHSSRGPSVAILAQVASCPLVGWLAPWPVRRSLARAFQILGFSLLRFTASSSMTSHSISCANEYCMFDFTVEGDLPEFPYCDWCMQRKMLQRTGLSSQRQTATRQLRTPWKRYPWHGIPSGIRSKYAAADVPGWHWPISKDAPTVSHGSCASTQHQRGQGQGQCPDCRSCC